MEEYGWLLFTIIMVVVTVIIHLLRSDEKKQAIRREINRLGGEIIEISENYFDGDRGTYTYKVIFTDQFGEEFQTSCKVRELGERLYWTTSPSELIVNSIQNNNGVGSSGKLDQSHIIENRNQILNSSSKEELIDKLSSSFKYERIAATEEITRLGSVDEQVIHLLQEMKTSDTDQEVRDAAKKSLSVLGRE